MEFVWEVYRTRPRTGAREESIAEITPQRMTASKPAFLRGRHHQRTATKEHVGTEKRRNIGGYGCRIGYNKPRWRGSRKRGGSAPCFPGKVTVCSVSHRDQFRNVLHTLQPALRAAKEPVQLAVRGAPQRARQLAAGYSERTAQRTRGQLWGGASSPGN